MAKDESRVQSLLSAFTRKRAAPPKERAEVKDAETTKSAYTPAMKAAAAGITAAALNVVSTSGYNSTVDEQYRLSPRQQVISAIKQGAMAAGAVGAFTHTEGKPMAARLALSAGAFLAAPAALKALEVATNSDLDGTGKKGAYRAERRQIAAHKKTGYYSGSLPLGRDSRPYM